MRMETVERSVRFRAFVVTEDVSKKTHPSSK
jgi:hypothetical protein